MARQKVQRQRIMTAGEKRAAQKWGNDTMGKAQRKNLSSRINEIRCSSWALRRREEQKPEPASVVAARKIIDKYETARDARIRKATAAIERACQAADSAVLFSTTPHAANAVVERLEKRARGLGWLEE